MARWRSFRGPRWRAFTWVIIVLNVLFLIWLITALVGGPDSCSGESGLSKDVCETLATVGASVGVALIVSAWTFADVILGVLWLVTPPGGRPCAVCGSRVKEGVTVCPACGFDFRAAAAIPGRSSAAAGSPVR